MARAQAATNRQYSTRQSLVYAKRYGSIAKTAASTIARAWRAYKSRTKTKTRSKKKAGRGFTGVSTHNYAGRFRKATRRTKESLVTKFAKTGVVDKNEIYGSINDPDCVYIGHSTWVKDTIEFVIFEALVKKVFKKAGITVPSTSQELLGADYNTSQYWTIKAIWKDPIADTQIPYSYDVPNDSSLRSVAANMWTAWKAAAVDPHSTTTYLVERVWLCQTGTTNIPAAELNVKEEILEVYVSSALDVQNRTKGASAATTESGLDRVDNQPLKGYRYMMIGGAPQLKNMGPQNFMNPNGVILKRAAQLTTSDGTYAEPILPKQVSNCTKSSYVALEPGTIKSSRIFQKHCGYFNNLMRKLASYNQTSNGVLYGPGKCEMFALEERLNTGSSNPITVSYEAQRVICARLFTTRKTITVPWVSSTTFNNVV